MRKLDGKVLVLHNDEVLGVYLAGQLGDPMKPEDMLWLAEQLIETVKKHSGRLEMQREKIHDQFMPIGMVEGWHE